MLNRYPTLPPDKAFKLLTRECQELVAFQLVGPRSITSWCCVRARARAKTLAESRKRRTRRAKVHVRPLG